MANVKSLFYNDSLKSLINSIEIKKNQKKLLLSKISGMNQKERERLFKTLTEVFLLDKKEDESLKRVERFWKK